MLAQNIRPKIIIFVYTRPFVFFPQILPMPKKIVGLFSHTSFPLLCSFCSPESLQNEINQRHKMLNLLKYISGGEKGFYNYRLAAVFNTRLQTLQKIRDKTRMHVCEMSIIVSDPIQANLFTQLELTVHDKMKAFYFFLSWE